MICKGSQYSLPNRHHHMFQEDSQYPLSQKQYQMHKSSQYSSYHRPDDTTGLPVSCSHCHRYPKHYHQTAPYLLRYKSVSQRFSSWYTSSRRDSRVVSQSNRLYDTMPLLSSLQTKTYALSRRLRYSLLESTQIGREPSRRLHSLQPPYSSLAPVPAEWPCCLRQLHLSSVTHRSCLSGLRRIITPL